MEPSGFQTFGVPHLAAIALTAALAAFLPRYTARRQPKVATRIAIVIAAILLANDLVYWTYRIHTAGVDAWLQQYLPLHVCGAAVQLTAFTLIFRNRWTYDIAWFWGITGALNAVLTPGGMDQGFPAYRFFQYFIAHSGIVIGVIFATFGLGMRPRLRGLVRAFVTINLFAAAVAVANWLLDANYMYLRAPPPGTVSPFFFAPWPWYLLVLEVVAMTMFLVVLAPFAWKRLSSRSRDPRAPGSSAGGVGSS